MGRRRNRGPDIEGLVGAIVAFVFLLVFWASGFNIQRAVQILHGLLALLIVIVIVAAVAFVGFLIIRTVHRSKRAKAGGPTATYRSPARVRQQTVVNITPRERVNSWKKPTPWRADDVVVEETPNPDMTEPKPARVSVIEKLRATDWYQFEKVVGLIYESQGYLLTRRGGANPDGGIDLIIEKNGERAAVQCKRWKKWKVDVPKVRELIGSMTIEKLPRGVIVALNGFTLEAKQLAVEHNIDIIHDKNLGDIIAGLAMKDQLKVQAMLDDDTKHCPKCEEVMEWKIPPRGKSWKPFWGCPKYPRCHGKLQES